ncbi:ATP-binding cassette domain-containing protein [bacterium]|nr:ATP-binding cassette domain-containing protein [bacterium]
MIKFDQVSKRDGKCDKLALDDVSFDIDDGDFVFVTGHSGCGKTTLMRLLLRDLDPTQGHIYFDDQDLSRLSRSKVAKHRRNIGIVFQDYQLIGDLNVWENIALPLIIAKQKRSEVQERIAELLRVLGLEGYDQVFPSQLSGGEAQRVGLARALITAPKVIFADEPTGNLDSTNAREIMGLFKSINDCGTTVIMATHDINLIDQIPKNRHLKFRRGKLLHTDDDEATLTNPMGEVEPLTANHAAPRQMGDIFADLQQEKAQHEQAAKAKKSKRKSKKEDA